ncbi:MAG: hypothetical protein LBU91_01380 [Bacteroidales bacterium]|jgi:hypothetical protein|nr:hypothetical protein [Bacteroidales bacterium]
MKKKLICTLVCFCTISAGACFGQQIRRNDASSMENQKRTSINVGVLMGGGSLLGTDLEFLLAQRVGLQVGAGISSVGAGLNIHLKPQINSSFVSVAYWHQGFSDNHYASYLGPMFVYRAKKIFQAGIGLGAVTSKGPKWNPDGKSDVNAILLYSIGVYFPL